jgi:cell division protein FtsB
MGTTKKAKDSIIKVEINNEELEKKKRRYEYLKKWRANNPEKAKKLNADSQRKWAKNNPEKIKEKAKKQYQSRKSLKN